MSKRLIINETEELKAKVECIVISIVACAYCQVKKIEEIEKKEIFFKNIISFKDILGDCKLSGFEFDKIGIIFSNGKEKISICKTENYDKNEMKLANLNGFDKDSLLKELAMVRSSTLREIKEENNKEYNIRILFYKGKAPLFEKKFNII